MAGIIYPKQALKWDKHRKQIRLPLGNGLKKEFGTDAIYINLPRELYRTANNQYINTDTNTSANILRKVSITLGLCLDGVSTGSLTTHVRLRL